MDTATSSAAQVIQITRSIYDLFDRKTRDESWFEEINKSPDAKDKPEQHTSLGVILGEKQPPFNMEAAIAFKNQNPHHSTCIETKARSTIGLGFVDAGQTVIEDSLDPLCDTSFQDLMNSVVEDYWQVGNGYIEVVRADKGDTIVGLHYIPAPTVRVIIEDSDYNYAYAVKGELGMSPKILACFGERDAFLARLSEDKVAKRSRGRPKNRENVEYSMYRTSFGSPSLRSEIIHFKRCTSMSRWYGFPDWLSAIAHIELVQMMVQERFDFFQNRGVPEFMLFLLGKKVGPDTWKKIEVAIQATVGAGNQHKTLAINIDDPELVVQLEKLAMDGAKGGSEFSQMAETLSLDIVSAHRTPPLLAGIQISGKLGATNELPNALLAFQVLVIGPEQHSISTRLGSTLGNTKRNGGLKTRAQHFKLKKITEEIPLGMGQQQPGATPTGSGAGAGPGIKALDTMGRMRTPAAASNGRDLSAGVKN